MLFIGRTKEKTIALGDAVILLLLCLGFVINQKNSVMCTQSVITDDTSSGDGISGNDS